MFLDLACAWNLTWLTSFNIIMNIPALIPLRAEQIHKYLPKAVELTLTQHIAEVESLSRQQKAVITKIFKNLNVICKLSVKQVKEVIKNEPAYQDALADLYFDKKLNNYLLITNQQKPVQDGRKLILERENCKSNRVCGVEYRMEFTVANIGKKNVMKPVILLIFQLKGGESLPVYMGVEGFWQLRESVAECMKQALGVELRAL